MGLVAGREGDIDGYEPVELRPGTASASRPAAMFRRRSVQPSRRGVLYLQAARDTPVPPDLASWYTERGFHFYVAALRWPGRRRSGRALAAAFAELDTRCEHLRGSDGIDNVIVTAHGEGATAAALWCAAGPAHAVRRPAAQQCADGPDSAVRRPAAQQCADGPDSAVRRPAAQQCADGRPGSRADALILYAPSFRRKVRRGLDIACPVLVVGGAGGPRAGRPATVQLGRHVTWLAPADAEARPDAASAEDRRRFFDEMGRWLGAYMYGQVRDQLL
jgi:hypothetical protein